MASPAVAPIAAVSLKKTEECVFITTHTTMGIGRMRQIRNLEVVTTADKSLLRHQKQLIDSPELDEIRSQDGYMTRHIDSKSSRYSKATRFIQKTELAALYKSLRAYQEIRRPALVAKFMTMYRALEAVDFEPLSRPSPEGLGDKFDRGDYPNSDVVEAGFSFTFNIRPVGAINLEGLPDFIVAMELEKELAIRQAAVLEWRDAMRLMGMEAVDALVNALTPDATTGKSKRLFDTTVTNLTEYLDTYANRDLAGDAEYQEKVVTPLRSIMKGVTMDKIRESQNLKKYVHDKVASIKQTAAVLVQETGRKFR
jgi:hypothetical protein